MRNPLFSASKAFLGNPYEDFPSSFANLIRIFTESSRNVAYSRQNTGTLVRNGAVKKSVRHGAVQRNVLQSLSSVNMLAAVAWNARY